MDNYSQIYNHILFRFLEDSSLKSLSDCFQSFQCDEGAVLYYNQDRKGSLYLFLEGEFCASDSKGEDKDFFFSGDYSNPQDLIESDVFDKTLICRSPGSYLKLDKEDFLLWVNNLKRSEANQLYMNLGLSLNSEDLKEEKPEEETSRIWRKSWFFLYEQLKYPLYIALFLFFLSGLVSFPYDRAVYKTIALVLMFFSAFKLILWLSERYFLNKRNLSSLKFSFSPLCLRQIVLPLDQIRGIRVEKKRLKNRFFNVGSLHVQTSSGTVLILSDLDKPEEIEKVISHYLQQSDESRQERERLDIRKKVEEHFQANVNIHGEEKVREVELEKPKEYIFRKSVVNLFSMIWWQILAMGSIITLSWIFRHSGGSYLLFSSIPFFGVFLWRFQDWRNDLYKVGAGKITDINRKPFGKSETSNLTDMEHVTNVRSEKKGFFQYLFNYGNVYIETAGGNICFEFVTDPLAVQNRLLEVREQWKNDEEKKQRDRQFQDFLVYSEIYKQAEEQNRLNRLTPPRPGVAQQGV